MTLLASLRLVTLGAVFSLGATLALSACSAGDTSVESTPVEASTDELNGKSSNPPLPVGTVLRADAAINLRTQASWSASVLRIIPENATVTVAASAPQNGFYKVVHAGITGWTPGSHLNVVSNNDAPPSDGARSDAINKAKSAVGFSYWWGHGRWSASGPTASTKGTCSGSCPSCSHKGQFGSDCSGLVAKAWAVPGSGSSLDDDAHPYNTSSFDGPSTLWTTIARNSLSKADALVYNDSGSGHIVLYSSGDGWGSFYSFECKGCSSGCVYNLRTASSAYKAIRRTGF